MAVLHGSWVSQGSQSGFFLWGETWRRLEESSGEAGVPVHPYAMDQSELLAFLAPLPLKVSGLEEAPKRGRKSVTVLKNWQARLIALPTEGNVPQLSAAPVSEWVISPWKVEGLWLDSAQTFALLNSVPLGMLAEESFLGGDLRFWSHTARWALDLLARSKFLPDLDRWEVLLDSSTDQMRLRHFVRKMPSVCRLYQSGDEFAVDLPIEPQDLLRDFLNHLIDAQVRKSVSVPRTPSILQTWIQGLSTKAATLNETDLTTLSDALEIWKAPLQKDQEQFRVCLKLIPPVEAYQSWVIEYLLQAIDDPEFVVNAQTIWRNPVEQLPHQGRVIDRPQETLLMGLGLASRLYPVIEPSLQEARPQAFQLDPKQAYEFIMNTVWRLQDSGVGVILPESLANRGGLANRLGLRIKASTPTKQKKGKLGLQGLLNFEWELSIGGQSLTKKEFDRLVAQNSPLVEINGEWVELRASDIKSAQSFFAARKDQTTLSLEDALRISTGDTQTIEKLPVVTFEASGALQELVTTLTGTGTPEEIETPKSFNGELRPYQKRGVSWLRFLEKWGLGACLADDMGLGKSPQFLAFLIYLKEQKLLEKPALLICPTSVLGNWEREIKKFTPSLKVLVHHGDKRSQGKAFQSAIASCDLVLTSYPLVQRDVKTLTAVSWQGIALDEAQNIKNAESKQSQAVRELEAEFRIALTGTPVENRLTELWSILDFLNPGYLGQKNFFQRRFAIPIERYGDTTSMQTLRSLTQPFILRRLKTDKTIIQDLPEKQEMAVYCGLSTEQAALYQATVDRSLAEIEASEGIQRKGIILALLTKLKQICNHPALFNREELAESNRSVKLQRLEEMLEEAVSEGDRALIFTQFAEWGKLLKPHLEKQLGRETLFLYGSTPKKQREEMIDRFQNDPQAPRIFILSLKAGGVGLNLTRANHVFHYDRWWNPAVENQATDRVFRIGQTRNVQVHKFVCTGTLEERIHDMIESKKALAEQVVGTGENWLTELNTDQLRDLLLLDRTAVIEE
ncbi:MAG: DEAD/DEAH box helicase [Leptolyngbya sp. Prado105]|nr:DEAD/DEAH box helicase [Leptolyngbya sp. Prado105]